MNLNSYVQRSVTVRLDAAEMFRYTGQVRHRESERTADIKNVAAIVREYPNGSPALSFTIEGPNVNKDGTAGAVYRRFEFTNEEASRVLPPHIYDAVLEAFNAQGCPPLRNVRPQHPSEA